LLDTGALHAPHFWQRGSLWPFRSTCSCSCSSSSFLWPGFGVMAGSLSSLPTSKQELCAPQCTVCFSHAPQMIAPPAVSPPLPLRVEGQLLCLCAPGARSKAGEVPPNAYPPRASPVRTRSVRTSGTPMRTSTRLLGDGKHGQAELIQTFRGPACRTTFTRPSQYAPVSTENALAPGRHGADHALAEGLDPSAASRVFGFRQASITSLSVACGLARTQPARALLLPSAPPAPPLG
jgi:hypothetical protein